MQVPNICFHWWKIHLARQTVAMAKKGETLNSPISVLYRVVISHWFFNWRKLSPFQCHMSFKYQNLFKKYFWACHINIQLIFLKYFSRWFFWYPFHSRPTCFITTNCAQYYSFPNTSKIACSFNTSTYIWNHFWLIV